MENKYQQWRTRSRVAGKLPFGMILALMTGDNSIPAVDASGCTGCNGRLCSAPHKADKRTLDEASMSDRNGSQAAVSGALGMASMHWSWPALASGNNGEPQPIASRSCIFNFRNIASR